MQNSLVNLCECLETVGKVQGAEADGVPSDKLFMGKADLLSAVWNHVPVQKWHSLEYLRMHEK